MLGEWATARSELGGELGGAPGLAEELGSGAGLAEDGVGDAAGLGHDIIGNVSVLPVRTMKKLVVRKRLADPAKAENIDYLRQELDNMYYLYIIFMYYKLII